MAAPYASATTPLTHTEPAVTDVRTVAAFDFSTGDAPENLTVGPDGSLTVSMLGSFAGKPPELVRFSASGTHRTVLATGVLGDTFTGNTLGGDGTVYYNLWSADASRSGVWALPPNSRTPRRIAALPADALPNGLAIDPSGRTLYVADSHKSTIWAVPAAGGRAHPWLTDQALAPVPDAEAFGANGLRFHNGAVWVSNFSAGTLMRVPVTRSGTAGPVHRVTEGAFGIDDFAFLGERSDVVLAAVNAANHVEVVHPDGTRTTVLTAADGLASPTATAVRGTTLYITDAGVQDPHHPQLQSATINPRALRHATGS
ncbi:hypothetical protein ACFW3D_20040 [Streptomyces sp. NPDC058864]